MLKEMVARFFNKADPAVATRLVCVGRVERIKNGIAFLRPVDPLVLPDVTWVRLSARDSESAFLGDRMRISVVVPKNRGTCEASLIEHLGHMRHLFTASVIKISNIARTVRVKISEKGSDIALDADFSTAYTPVLHEDVLIRMRYDSSTARGFAAVVERFLGKMGDPAAELAVVQDRFDFSHTFSEEIAQELAALDVDTQDHKCVDLRSCPFVTIDGETARDFDDAVYAQEDGAGFRLRVAIADVSHYVRPGSALDQEAFLRGTSVYFPQSVIPMLPERLSNDLCSLKPHEDRRVLVCDMRINQRGVIDSYAFHAAVICSCSRLTYNDVAYMLQHPDAKQDKVVLRAVQILYKVFQVLLTERQRRGAIDFNMPESVVCLDENDRVTEIISVERNDAHRLIEECMLAANVCSAHFLSDHRLDGLYRVHEPPEEKKVEQLRIILLQKMVSLKKTFGKTPRDYLDLITQIIDRPDAHQLQVLILRSLQQARYCITKKGHFGLAYDAYTHFTSPIRRYPDLMIHRLILGQLRAQKKRDRKVDWSVVAAHCTMTEKRAEEASRDMLAWYKCCYMLKYVGQQYTGTISAITDFGLFVFIEGLNTEGVIHISRLGHDYYVFHPDSLTLRGERTHKCYCIGDSLTILVESVNLHSRRIELRSVERTTAVKKKKKKI